MADGRERIGRWRSEIMIATGSGSWWIQHPTSGCLGGNAKSSRANGLKVDGLVRRALKRAIGSGGTRRK